MSTDYFKLACDITRAHAAGVQIVQRRAEIERLRAALEKAADTFADLKFGLRLLNRPLLAQACEVAERASREALR